MRSWIFAALFVAACASAEPAAPTQTTTSGNPTYSDARSSASDAEVRDARRAYRSACQQRHPDGYCECMTGGMAQALGPRELAVATAELTGQNVAASSETRARAEATRAEVDRGCARFRRG